MEIPQKVNLAEKLASFSDHWSPKVVGELNGQEVRLSKMKGAFIWHHHEHEDELFLVLKGHLTIELRDRAVQLEPGEFFIVPRGVDHKPVAHGEVEALIFEPAATLNTGQLRNERTIDNLDRI